MFGVPLSVIVQRTGESLPKPVLAAMHYLRQSALDQVGLFRKSGVRSRIAKLKELCETWAGHSSTGPSIDDDPVDFSQHQPYDVADMIKQYFRELPEALMTNKLSETFVTIFQGSSTVNLSLCPCGMCIYERLTFYSSGSGSAATGRVAMRSALVAGRASRGVADVPGLPDGRGRSGVHQPDDAQQLGRLSGPVAVPLAGQRSVRSLDGQQWQRSRWIECRWVGERRRQQRIVAEETENGRRSRSERVEPK